MMNIKSIALLLVLAFAGAQASVVDTIAATPELSAVLEAASAYPDLVAALSDEAFAGTLFLPSNEVLTAAIEAATKAGTPLSAAAIKVILSAHVVPTDRLEAGALALLDGEKLATLVPGSALTVASDGTTPTVVSAGGVTANVVTPNIDATETAIIHIINAVLIPANNALTPAALATVQEGIDALAGAPVAGPVMAEAPVVDGETPIVDAETPMAGEEVLAPTMAPTVAPEMTLIETATAANLTVLIDAVVAAGLGDTIANFKGTIFAPTNEALVAAVTAAGLDLEDLTEEQMTILAGILAYHVVPAIARAADLVDGQELPTLNGANLTVSIVEGTVTIIGAFSNATVILADVEAGGSIVHVIDAVLLPIDLFGGSGAEAPAAGTMTPAPAPAPAGAASSTAVGSIAALAASLLAAALLV